ncbi:hypothetical protein TNCT_468361 [Trichonephila clavata]|uniref:Uncharacterized protein n=1 Tax=Trichonephila clavata TaxID=2740835 RepID=A0A8X6KYV3_TRICU|nr:hypothetical protein TNCT_468361 [Trichonephila clavata]
MSHRKLHRFHPPQYFIMLQHIIFRQVLLFHVKKSLFLYSNNTRGRRTCSSKTFLYAFFIELTLMTRELGSSSINQSNRLTILITHTDLPCHHYENPHTIEHFIIKPQHTPSSISVFKVFQRMAWKKFTQPSSFVKDCEMISVFRKDGNSLKD